MHDWPANKPLNQNHDTAARLCSAVVATALCACLLVTGCASGKGGRSSGQAAARIIVLRDSLDPLRQQFNADRDKLRVLALFSPT